MPTPLQIVTQGASLAHTKYTDYPNKADPTGIRDFNVIYKDIIHDIRIWLKERKFWTYAYENSIIDQNEYNISTFDAGGDTLDIMQIDDVYIKYNTTDSYYTKAERKSPKGLVKDEDWYSDNQSEAIPFYFIRDNSVFIYPKTKEVVSQGIKFNVLYIPKDLIIGDTEADIKIQKSYHDVLEIGIKMKVFEQQGKQQEFQNTRQEYKEAKLNMIKQMRGRNNGTIQNKDNN